MPAAESNQHTLYQGIASIVASAKQLQEPRLLMALPTRYSNKRNGRVEIRAAHPCLRKTQSFHETKKASDTTIRAPASPMRG